MKNFLALLLFFVALMAKAETPIYVTDQIRVMVRSGEGIEFQIIRRLSTGTALILLEKNPESGYTKVRLKNGQEGWVLSRYLTDQPVAQWLLESARKKLKRIERENISMTAKLKALQTENVQTKSNNQNLSIESEQLQKELSEIRQTAGNALQIQKQRDQYQERVINLERELQKIKRDKQALEDSAEQDWFMIGAGVLFAGIVLGLILPQISWRRKTSSWDSF